MLRLIFLFCTLLVWPEHISNTDYKIKLSKIENQYREIQCLTENIFFESRSESRKGKLAVAFVTMNRLDQKKYGSSICSVVYFKNKGVCQFSWVCDKNLMGKRHSIKNIVQYQEARIIAEKVYFNKQSLMDPTFGSTHFHSNKIYTNCKIKKTVTIGNHIFYKEQRI